MDLTLRNDSQFCRAYIQGDTLASIEEVVATMILTTRLFEFGYPAWSTNKCTFESMLEQSVFEDRLSWTEAVVKLTESHFFETANMDVYFR
jgi:hypothetical protein